MTDFLYNAIIEEVQQADELGGPEGMDYIDLMERVSEECLRRAEICRANMASDQRERDEAKSQP